jgi:hypothetical protein
MFDDIIKQLKTLEGEELMRFWLTTPRSGPFREWYLKEAPPQLIEKITRVARQWIDLWAPEGMRILNCWKCKTPMVIDPDPVAKTRWRCPACNDKY